MRHTSPADHEKTVPQLDHGLTLLHRPSARSPALHQLVLSELTRTEGTVYWVDARNNASSYALYERAPNRADLDRIRLARAFTAYQHHTLVRSLPRRVTGRTAFVVVPCTASLYGDDDLPDQEAQDLLEAALTILRELATAFEIPVLVTTTGGDRADLLADYAATEIEATRTSLGLHFETEKFETQVYWHEGFWQTTIPYWVDLFGAVQDPDPVVTAAEPNLLDVLA